MVTQHMYVNASKYMWLQVFIDLNLNLVEKKVEWEVPLGAAT